MRGTTVRMSIVQLYQAGHSQRARGLSLLWDDVETTQVQLLVDVQKVRRSEIALRIV